MIESSVTMRHERVVRPLPANALRSGLLEVPARRFAAAGVEDKTFVAASPEGCPSVPEILKFTRFFVYLLY
jgi:hypothetical protein